MDIYATGFNFVQNLQETDSDFNFNLLQLLGWSDLLRWSSNATLVARNNMILETITNVLMNLLKQSLTLFFFFMIDSYLNESLDNSA